MRILQIASSLPLSPTGSNAPFILHIARSLSERGHDVHLVAPYHPRLEWGDRHGSVSLHFFRYAPLPSWNLWGYAQSLHSDVRLKAAVFAVLPFAVASAVRCLGRLQASGFRPDLLHAHWLLPNGPIAALARRGTTPLFVSLHGSDIFVAQGGRAYRSAARFALRRAAAVVGCSEDLTERARGLYPQGSGYATLPYGVDEERFRPAERPGDEPVILAAGRLVEKKGFEYLLTAMRQMRHTTRLVIAGDGDLSNSLRQRASELGVASRVEFVGEADQPTMIRLYQSADVFALPSVHDSGGNVDGLPNVLLEAMSCGLAVVASRIGGVPQVVRDGENGIMVDEKSPEALAAALDPVLANADLRRRLGAAARRTIIDGFTWKQYGRKLEGLMQGAGAPC